MSKAGKYTVIGLFVFWCLFVIAITGIERFSAPQFQDVRTQVKKSYFEENRLIDIAKISHVERTVHILKFAHGKLGGDLSIEQEVVYLINAEWNGALRNLYLISVQDIFADDELRQIVNPINNPDKDNLMRSIIALEEKIAKARKYFNLPNTATEYLKE